MDTAYKKIIRMFVGENESIVALFVIANKNILYFQIQLHITMFPPNVPHVKPPQTHRERIPVCQVLIILLGIETDHAIDTTMLNMVVDWFPTGMNLPQ